MSAREPQPVLTISQLADASGVAEGTLRMWESRHGFPVPRRLPSGHRRYSERDLEQVRAVVRARDEGLALPAAIGRARRLGEEPRPSVYRALRERFPELQPHLLPKHVLVHLSHAIEDESALRARRPLLCACFQHERFYRAAEDRWLELSRTADRALVFADFPETRRPAEGPAQIRVELDHPLMREWVILCDAPRHAACMVGWERPRQAGDERRFETLWTVDPAVVREAARVCCALAARQDPQLVDGLADQLADTPRQSPEELRDAVDLTTRMVLYATGAGR